MKQITQRVKLSRISHLRIVRAQKTLGLARFDEGLGFFIDGMIGGSRPSLRPNQIVDRMRRGMGLEKGDRK